MNIVKKDLFQIISKYYYKITITIVYSNYLMFLQKICNHELVS